jgi:hypothetical protein
MPQEVIDYVAPIEPAAPNNEDRGYWICRRCACHPASTNPR